MHSNSDPPVSPEGFLSPRLTGSARTDLWITQNRPKTLSKPYNLKLENVHICE